MSPCDRSASTLVVGLRAHMPFAYCVVVSIVRTNTALPALSPTPFPLFLLYLVCWSSIQAFPHNLHALNSLGNPWKPHRRLPRHWGRVGPNGRAAPDGRHRQCCHLRPPGCVAGARCSGSAAGGYRGNPRLWGSAPPFQQRSLACRSASHTPHTQGPTQDVPSRGQPPNPEPHVSTLLMTRCETDIHSAWTSVGCRNCIPACPLYKPLCQEWEPTVPIGRLALRS